MSRPVSARAPGRIVLLGDQVGDGTATLLTAALDRGITFQLDRQPDWIELMSATDPDPALIPTDVVNPATGRPVWARYVAAAVAVLKNDVGGTGFVASDLPSAVGLGSSTALTMAALLALGFEGDPRDLALATHRAETLARGRPTPLADPLTLTVGRAGHVLVVDGLTLTSEAVAVPDGLELLAVPTGEQRDLDEAAYAVRREQCEEAAGIVGALRMADPADIESIGDDLLRRRARHVRSEEDRVRAAAAALKAGDLTGLGEVMADSQESLASDLEVVSGADADLVASVAASPGVYGARLSGTPARCVVAVAEAGARVDLPTVWRFRPGGAAALAPPRPD